MNQDLIDNRHIRLFISSTFQDMKDERSYLMTQTFPLLRKLAAERNVTLTELDLRWGITEDEAKNGKVVDICLREVENSIPFFIGIIGNRYGWIPKKEDIWEGTIDRYSQVDEYLKEHLSVTEMEMQFGVLQRKEKMHAYFYIKEEQAENIDYPEMLKRLKEEVIHSDYPSSYYSSKENLSEQIEQAFRDLLDELFPMENTTELEKERIGQRAYKNQLCLSYIKGDQNFKVLDDWLRDANKRQLVITGASGLGKSALLANWINEKLHDKERDYNIIYHFTGNGGSQSSYHYVEKIIRDEIADQYHWTEEGVRTLSLEQLFNKIVAEKQKPLLIVIDAINQLADEDDAKLLNWMPDANKSVKILYSTLEEDKTMGALKRRDYPIFTLQPLDKEQRRQLIEKHLGNFAKRLNKRQVQRIADSNLCENTLVLRSLLDELISFGVYEKLDERINSYLTQDTIEDFYQIYLSHLEEGLNSFESFIQCEPERSYTLDQLDKMFEDFKNGHEDVDDSQWEPFAVNFFSDVVLSILLSKNGLTEDEIFSILTKDKNTPDEFKIKRIELSRILCSLSSHIVMRNGLVTFSHTFISNAIWEKYVKSQKNEQHEADMLIWARRNEIVDFLKSEEFEFSERAYEEIAYQLYKLTELPFEPKWYQNKYDKLLNETRKQQKHWYISVDDFSRVEYTLQSSDEQKIRLVHCYKPDSYYFHNFSGFYTNAEYRALEKAILAIERIKAAQSKRNEIKNKSSSQGIKRKDSVLNDLQENTWNGRCKWTEIKDPKWFGAFRTVYRESQIVFIIIQNQGPASFSYYLKYVNTREYWKLKQREGEYLADLIKRQFRQATANITNLDSSKVEVVKKTAAQVHKEQVALIKARDEAIRQKKLQRMTLENDLTNVLMQKYKSEDRKDYFGIEFLASGSSIRELEHIRGAVLPADIYEFRRTTAEFLSKINRGGNQSPEVVDLYKELIRVC